MRPRVAVAGFQHETNTFSPLPTDYAAFEAGGAWPALTRGAALLDTFPGLNIPLGGFLRAAEPFEIVPLLWTSAKPSGLVSRDAFERIAGEIGERLAAAGPLDGLYLDLHGAMVTETHEDGEAALLAHLRGVAPDLPMIVSLDLHANVGAAFARLASGVTMYRTYPHVDMGETGARAARLMARRIAHGPFVHAVRKPAFIPAITDQSTMREPGRGLYARLPGLEEGGVEALEFAFGFPPADIRDCGPAVLAYGTDQEAVDRAADAMAGAVLEAERAMANPLVPAAEAVALAMAAPRGPVVLCDPQDNPGAGAPGDATGLLAALIEAGAEDACLGAFWDPEAAAHAHGAGVGAEIAVSLGGRFPEIGGPALAATATVEALSDGVVPFTGPMYGGAVGHLGPMARLRVGGVAVVVASRRAQNADRAIFRAVGIAPERQRIVAVKSAVHFLADYEPMAARVIFVAAPGANPCALDTIPYRRLRAGVRLGANGPVSG